MRSRYTAFALRDLEHLLASWHPRTRPAPEELTESLRPDVRWLRLEVLATDPGAVADFQAFCKSTGNELIEYSEEGGVYRFLIRHT